MSQKIVLSSCTAPNKMVKSLYDPVGLQANVCFMWKDGDVEGMFNMTESARPCQLLSPAY